MVMQLLKTFDCGSILVLCKVSRHPVSTIMRYNERDINFKDSQIENGIELLQRAGEHDDGWASVCFLLYFNLSMPFSVLSVVLDNS